MGVDFIKVKSFLHRNSYFSIADEASREHMVLAGDVPDSVTVSEASSAGQRSIEHLTGVALGCSTNETLLMRKLAEAFAARDRAGYGQVQAQARTTFDDRKAASLFNLFVRNGTWQVPTLVELRRNALGSAPSDTLDPKWEYIPRALRSAWERAATEQPDSSMKESFPGALALTRQMHAADVRFLAGTDSPNPSIVPGFSLHEELSLLVNAGFTPMEALQAATRNPAQYLHREFDLGTIEVGKLADMALLDANP